MQEPICGNFAEISVPDLPYRWNLCGLPSSTAVSFCKNANRTFLVNESGSFLPFISFSFGFGSNKSTWLVPPSMNRKMHCFAFGAKCGGRTAKGLVCEKSAASSPFDCRSDAKARPPRPLAAVARKSRRVTVTISLGSISNGSFAGHKFVQIHEHLSHAD